jgi:hypothetical protein
MKYIKAAKNLVSNINQNQSIQAYKLQRSQNFRKNEILTLY